MGDFLDNHIEDILAGMPSPKEIIQQELEEEIKRLQCQGTGQWHQNSIMV